MAHQAATPTNSPCLPINPMPWTSVRTSFRQAPREFLQGSVHERKTRHGNPLYILYLHPIALSHLAATGSPRKCCKQKTYGLAKPFRCNRVEKPWVANQGVLKSSLHVGPRITNRESPPDGLPPGCPPPVRMLRFG